MRMTGARTLIIGLDGADWRVMNPLLEAGKIAQSNVLD